MIDPAELAAMRQQIDEARKLEEEILAEDKETEKQDANGISKRFIAECFRLNERGDGMLFAAIHCGKFVHVKKLDTWLYWAGNHWKIDEEDLHIDAADLVAQYYESYAADLRARIDDLRRNDKNAEAKMLDDLVRQYKKRINKIRTLKGARVCCDYSFRIGPGSLSVREEQLDQKPMLLACSNCVVDLSTGEMVESKPEDYILNAVKVEWKGINEPCPTWENFFDVIHQSDVEIKRLVHAMLGYSTTGLRTEHFLGCFIGEGRNGKGTMFETIRAILGDLAWAISPELLLEQRHTRSSAGPSPDLYSLMGRRMVIASETDEGARISASQVKRLTGGDTIKTRSPHEKYEINFRPTHKLFLYSQHPPNGLAKDYALAKRLIYINYPLKFVDNPSDKNERQRDKDLPAKLEAEASGILAWLVRGALMWKADGGLKPPAKVLAAVEAQRRQDDVILQYHEDYLEPDDGDKYLKFADIYASFEKFFETEISKDSRYLPSKKKFSKWLADREIKTDKKSGDAIVYGLKFKPIG